MYTPLNEADVVPLHVRFQRQLLLRQSYLLPSFTENLAECQPCVQTLPPLYEVALSVQGLAGSSQYAVNFIDGMALLVSPEATTQPESTKRTLLGEVDSSMP